MQTYIYIGKYKRTENKKTKDRKHEISSLRPKYKPLILRERYKLRKYKSIVQTTNGPVKTRKLRTENMKSEESTNP
jgi:hypothetical protein